MIHRSLEDKVQGFFENSKVEKIIMDVVSLITISGATYFTVANASLFYQVLSDPNERILPNFVAMGVIGLCTLSVDAIAIYAGKKIFDVYNQHNRASQPTNNISADN